MQVSRILWQFCRYVWPEVTTKKYSSELAFLYENLVQKYPIYSIEDGLSEDDWSGCKKQKYENIH